MGYGNINKVWNSLKLKVIIKFYNNNLCQVLFDNFFIDNFFNLSILLGNNV